MCVCLPVYRAKTKSFGREKDPRHFHLYIYICAPFDQITMENMSSSIFFLSPSKRHFPFPAACPVYRSIVKIASFLSPPTIHSLTIWISCLLYIFHWLRLALFCHGIQQSNIFVSPPLAFIVAIVHATP